jgi:hypothetical protein
MAFQIAFPERIKQSELPEGSQLFRGFGNMDLISEFARIVLTSFFFG